MFILYLAIEALEVWITNLPWNAIEGIIIFSLAFYIGIFSAIIKETKEEFKKPYKWYR